jgi:PTH1 family peptidyl-tRNA hydrolase
MKIIFAQGNPEPDYSGTRHNVGFEIVNYVASQLNSRWTDKPKFSAHIAEVAIGTEKVLLVKPTCFYNQTGPCARKLIDFYKLDPATDLLVIHDDFALPFGTIRVRNTGSDAGNNGIKSINEHLSQSYARIRVGIYSELRDKIDDADFVLAKFNQSELDQLNKNILPQVAKLVNQFCEGTIQSTSFKNLE